MGGADAQSFFHICLKASLSVWGFGNGLKKHRKAKIQIAQNLESIGPQGFPGCIFFSNKTHMNEVRFSNIFIEKRTSCFLKALQLQGFFYLRSFNALVKKRKC